MKHISNGGWRMVALPLLPTAVVVGSALGFAFNQAWRCSGNFPLNPHIGSIAGTALVGAGG